MAPSIVSSGVERSLEDDDERRIAKLLNNEVGEDELAGIINNMEPTEKADDAVNYSDISDDDLAEDEDALPTTNGHAVKDENDDMADIFGDDTLPPMPSSEGPELEDLFGDHPSSSGAPMVGANANGNVEMSFDFEDDDPMNISTATIADLNAPLAGNDAFLSQMEAAASKNDFAVTQELIQANFDIPAPPENREELLAKIWPTFNKDEIPFWSRLLPSKRAQYIGRTPTKPPKPLIPTKLTLEIAQDHEKLFRMPSQTIDKKKTENEHDGLIRIERPSSSIQATAEEIEIKDEEEIAGMNKYDLELACEDWEAAIEAEPIVQETPGPDEMGGDDDAEWEREVGLPAAKKQKTFHQTDFFNFQPNDVPDFDDFESATRRIASKIELNLNDPKLLVETYEPQPVQRIRKGLNGILDRRANGNLMSKYNMSNDEAYDLLKENHQNKIRSQLGNLTLDHSLPAIRLQYPYYRTRLDVKDARSYHRPKMPFRPNEIVRFKKLGFKKRKNLKGKDATAIFGNTKDLTLADNSNILLLEYAEEHPLVMSNFGMQTRILNYYRRKGLEDKARPRSDIGETAILMPQDKSPFAMFGAIPPGEIMPTVYNGMFRAPIFSHQPKSTDFLVVRNSTGVDGITWHIRNLETLFTVGQALPSIDVPGPHSRKVTTAAKNRLKMISFRKLRRNPRHRLNVAEVTKHFPDTTDLQNRQKLKEFMSFSRDHREWEMKPGEAIPDETTLRAMVRPEDVCLLEAMQVGVRNLADSGFSKYMADGGGGDDDDKEGDTFEEQMAPWNLTRNYINATQGKAMLQLHGEGDPSGRGEAFNFIRTSMKGGFKPIGESVEDKLDAAKLKALGGHSYNVARQQKAYDDGIKQIWAAQLRALHSTIVPDEQEGPRAVDDDTDDPRAQRDVQTPASAMFQDDMSQFSRMSSASQRGKVLKITRQVRGRWETEIISDPRVIKEYVRRRRLNEADNTKLTDLAPTGHEETDKRNRKRLADELDRLERNKERRIARDKQKGIITEGDGELPGRPGTTQRKCANCGQVGHIKTNKKLCPMLNGTMPPPAAAGGFGAVMPLGATPIPTFATPTPGDASL